MMRPKSPYPTFGELEVLKILWDRGASRSARCWKWSTRTGKRHYTSVMSLLNTMVEKAWSPARLWAGPSSIAPRSAAKKPWGGLCKTCWVGPSRVRPAPGPPSFGPVLPILGGSGPDRGRD